jgi:hypothetical protein
VADRRRTTIRPGTEDGRAEEQLALLDPRLLSPVFRRPSAVRRSSLIQVSRGSPSRPAGRLRELSVKCYQIVPMAFVPSGLTLISPKVRSRMFSQTIVRIHPPVLVWRR